MDSKSRSEVRIPQAETPEMPLDGAKAPVNRWLVVAVAVLSVSVIALGAALIVGSGSEEAAPTRRAVTEPTTEPAAETEQPAASNALAQRFLPANFDVADPRLVRHVDGSIAFCCGRDPAGRFQMGGHGSSTGRVPNLHRYDHANGRMVLVLGVYQAVGARDVERTSPVVVVAGTADSGSWTVAFSVRAGADEQLWIQHWEEPWGEMLMEMWVI